MKLRIADNLTLPAEAVTEEDLHWAAGLFEGEGTVTIAVRRQDETYRLLCTLGNTDREVVEFFLKRWGGWFQPAYGEPPGRRPAWYWTVAGPRAEQFVRAIEPYIRTRRVRLKIDVALHFRAYQSNQKRFWSKPGYRETQRELYVEMRELNRRGVR